MQIGPVGVTVTDAPVAKEIVSYTPPAQSSLNHTYSNTPDAVRIILLPRQTEPIPKGGLSITKVCLLSTKILIGTVYLILFLSKTS